MLCSTSVTVHLLRGAAAVGLLFAAFFLSSFGVLWSALAVIGAVVLLRGCPMCWLMGLFETVANARQNQNQAPGPYHCARLCKKS
jgi:hypothetical protein